jgi:hypothetical protein
LFWGIYGCFDTDFFAVSGLKTRTVLSFGDVDSRVEVVVVVVRALDYDLSLLVVVRALDCDLSLLAVVRALENELSLLAVVSVMARKLYVDVGRRVFSAMRYISKRC